MEIYQIKVFLEVARHLSFTEAADALALTQPAVSAKIKSLESEIKAPLFYRTGRKIALTRVGKYLFEEGETLIHLENKILQNIEEIKRGKVGDITIGSTPNIIESWLPNIIFRYRQSYPEIQEKCLQFECAESLYRALANGQVNAGVSEIDFQGFAEISATAIDQICYYLLVASHHKLARQDWLSLRELQKEPWVLLPEGSPSRLIFETRLAELGLCLSEFSHVEVVDTPSLMRTYILQGQYLGFASSFEFQVERQSGIMAAISLQEFALAANLFLLLPKRLSQSASEWNQTRLEPLQKFIAFIQSQTSQLNQSPQDLSAQTAAQANLPYESKSAAGKPSTPVRFRSPNFTIRSVNAQRPDTFTISIGMQNGTIQTVTAGLVMQQLGLLEHFLPRDGRYSSTQYQVQWHDFTSGAPIVEGLQSQQLDIGVLGDYPLLLSAIQKEKTAPTASNTRLVSFIASNPDGSGNAVIVPHESQLQCIEDLQKRAIAVPFGSSAHGMVMRSLHKANLLSEVTLASIEDLSIDQIFQHSTKVDGYAYFAPFPEIARRGGKFRQLYDGHFSGLPAFHGVVVREALAEQHPEIVVAYLRALLAAQNWYTTTPSALSLVSQWSNLDSEIISQILIPFYRQERSGQFFLETKIQSDWVSEHVNALKHIPSNEYLQNIDLNHWIQPEFLQTAQGKL